MHTQKEFHEYHYLLVQSDVLLLADVFENIFKICLEIYGLDPAKFLSAPALAWQAALKKTKVRLDLLTDFDMLLMIGNVQEEECVTLFINMQNLITNTWKIMIKIKNGHIFNIGI